MPRILNICPGCAILRSATDDKCDNCGKDRSPDGWIAAVVSDEDGVTLEEIAGVMLDYKPE